MADPGLPDTLTPEQAARLGLVPPPAAKGGLSPDDLPDKLTPEQAAKLGFVGAKPAPAAPQPEPGVFDRIASGARKALDVTGTLASDYLDAVTGGGYKAARDLVASKIAPEATAQMQATEAGVHQGTLGQLAEGTARGLGYINPYSVATATGRAVGAGLGRLGEAAPLVGRVLSSRPVGGAVAGALTGGAVSGGEAMTSGASLPEAAQAAGAGALVGGGLGALGGTYEAVKSRIADGSPAKAKARIMSDLQGDSAGYSTKTARNQAVRDEADIADIVLRDPPLETALMKAKGNSVGDLGHVLKVVDERLATEGAPRSDYYKRLDATLASEGAPIRSGDYIRHLEDSAKALDATGDLPDRKIAEQLRRQVKVLKTSEDWGYKAAPPVAADPEHADALSNLVRRREALMARDEPVPQAIEDAIAGLSKPAHSEFDPNHVVSTQQLRRNVSSMQKAAESAEGGIHGTPNYELGREVASRGEDFLRQMKARAAAADPDLVAQINEHDRKVSALLRMRQVLDQRLGNARLNGMGSEGDGMFGRVLHTVAKGKHGVIRAAESELANRAMLGKRALERGARGAPGETEQAYAARVAKAMRDGLPLKAAITAATVERSRD